MNINDKTQVKKIYRGSFQYYQESTLYAEDTFEVFKDTKLQAFAFISNMHSRAPSGELLQISTYYEVNKNQIPVQVEIIKKLGNKNATESYTYDPVNSSLQYKFIGKKVTTEHSMNTNQKYHITLPTALTSTLFLGTKKFDTTSTNEFFFLVSNNQWIFKAPQTVRPVYVKKISDTSENLTVNKNIVQTIRYELSEINDWETKKGSKTLEEEKPVPPIEIFLSSHIAIPYIVKYNNTSIKIKQLNFMDE